jgi:hypothetical protein
MAFRANALKILVVITTMRIYVIDFLRERVLADHANWIASKDRPTPALPVPWQRHMSGAAFPCFRGVTWDWTRLEIGAFGFAADLRGPGHCMNLV